MYGDVLLFETFLKEYHLHVFEIRILIFFFSSFRFILAYISWPVGCTTPFISVGYELKIKSFNNVMK